MKAVLLLVISILTCSSSLCQKVSHVILISIDGLRPEMYRDKSWPAPNLRRLMKEGTYARHMKSVFPAYTYPSHTAMLTGALPARSKITYNAPIGSTGDWYWFTRDIKVPTLWQALKKNGLTTSAVEWPVSVDSTITWNIPEIWSKEHPEDRITETRKYATKGLIEEIERNATGRLDGNTMNEDYLTLDENSGRMAAYIFQKYKPNFLAVHFAEVDGMEHGYGREHDSVRLALATADHAIGDILEAVERSGMRDSTTVIIVGDHGFSTIHTVFRPNMLIRDVPAEFIPAGGSAFLYHYSDTKKEDVPAIVQSVTGKLNALPKKQRKLFRIIDRKELDKMGADSAAILALAAIPGTVFSGSRKGELTGKVTGGHHGYDPNQPEMYTGFIAAGAQINKGKVIDELCVTDIAPLIAKLLGIEFSTPDGKLINGILKDN